MRTKRSAAVRLLDKMLKNPYFLVAPAVIIVVTMTIYPMIFGSVVSLMKWDIVTGERSFVGIRNYANLFKNSDFRLVLRNTVVYVVSYVSISLVLYVVIGIFLNRTLRIFSFVQTVIFTPYVLSMVSVAVMFGLLYDTNNGLFNYILTSLGFEPLMWLRSESTSLMSIIIVAIWKDVGYGSLMVIAGLQSIPSYIYESAKLDNSSPFTTFRKITLPMLSPTIFLLFITKVIDAFKAFDVANIMTSGGPRSSSKLLVMFIYQEGYSNFRMGSAMAAAIILLVIVSLVSFVNFAFINNKVHYQ